MKDRRRVFLVVAVLVALLAWLVLWPPWDRPTARETGHRGDVAREGPRPVPSTMSVPGVPARDSTATGASTSSTAAPGIRSGVPAAASVGTPGGVSSSPASDGTASPTPPSARIEVEKVRMMIRSYHNVMGENPVGTNAEIMQALMGKNAKQAALGPPEGQSLNEKGELVDQWGTPFFFHQLSKDVMEIRSAGPDKIMGTADDSVIR